MTAVVYRCYDATGRPIYVGATEHLEDRLNSHRTQSCWYGLLDNVAVEEHPTIEAAREAEAKAIREDQPTFNIAHRGIRDRPLTDNDRRVMQAWADAKGGRHGLLPVSLRWAIR